MNGGFSAHDDATPNANGVMIGNLARLAILTGKDHYRDRAEIIHRRFSGELRSNPFGYASFMTGVLDLIDPIQLVTAGEADGSHLRDTALASLGPDAISLHVGSQTSLPPDHPAFSKAEAGRGSTLYLCRGNVCAAPARTTSELTDAIALLGLDRTAVSQT
jgi:uncharacterized protein YyaL (SSP411 family)